MLNLTPFGNRDLTDNDHGKIFVGATDLRVGDRGHTYVPLEDPSDPQSKPVPAVFSDFTAYMYLGDLIEFGVTDELFIKPKMKQTEDYITGRFG